MRFALLYFEVKELWGIGPVNTFFFFNGKKWFFFVCLFFVREIMGLEFLSYLTCIFFNFLNHNVYYHTSIPSVVSHS